MTSLIFAKRNLTEFMRTPIMFFFAIIFPILMFLVFQVIKLGTGATDDIVPMFTVENLVSSIAVFSFAFIALTLSTQISADRSSSFQARLRVSPMRPIHFFLGYLIPSLMIAALQIILTFLISFCFGLEITLNLIFAFFVLLIISVFYISLGIVIGCLFNEKSCGGISSILVNLTAILSGMFFPLTDGTFKTILSFLPFYPSVTLPNAIITQSFENFLTYILVLLTYLILAAGAAILIFRKKLSSK